MASASTPRLLCATSDTEAENKQVIIAPQSSRIEQALYEPSHLSRSELLSWFAHHKRSANFHLKEYFHFKELWEQELEVPESQSFNTTRDLAPKDYSPSAHSENYWNMKVAKDSFIAELTAMGNLLEDIGKDMAGKRQGKIQLSSSVAFSAFGVMSLIAWMTGVNPAAALISSSLLCAYRPIKYLADAGIIRLCKSQAMSIKEMAESGKLESQNPSSVTVPRFRFLRWILEP